MNLWLKILIVFLLFILLIIILSVNYIDGYRYITLNSHDIFQLDREYKYKPRIKNCIISLTTIPNRLKHIKPILISLLDSSVAVDEIRLNIPYKSCKGIKYVIPKWLTKLKSVKIYRVEKDWGPATKLLPTLLDNWNTDKKIIVVDDDVIYGYYMVETINQYFEKYNIQTQSEYRSQEDYNIQTQSEYRSQEDYNIQTESESEYRSQGDYNYRRTQRDHNTSSKRLNSKKVAITMYGDEIDEKCKMKYDFSTRAKNYMNGECYTDVLRGHAAYMVTPKMFTKDIFDYSKTPSECFFVDDNYFSCHLKRNKVRILMVGLSYKAVPLTDTINAGLDALHQTHNENGKNEVIVNRHFALSRRSRKSGRKEDLFKY